ncbi:MAG TPA: DUF192 domain-containing protein [Acidimicrobiales bacterium]|nr:DUF192 domain-containing protein [Acidimicrobiales bacterium]
MTGTAREGHRRGWLVWAGGLGAVAVLIAVMILGANWPADPYFVESGGRTPVEGFGQIGFRVEGSAASSTERCALLAETTEQRSRGLMNRTDLAGHDGMIFRFQSDTNGSFYMKDTPLPLSIAWFDSTGAFVSSTDMEPCLDQPSCPTYSATGPYRYALEVPKGALMGLGVGPGSRLVLGGRCR